MQGTPRFGPSEPATLITVEEARSVRIWVYCAGCHHGRYFPAAALPACRTGTTLGELWLQGRFRCATCRRPADALSLNCDYAITRRERWQLGDRLIAERLRRHWRAQP